MAVDLQLRAAFERSIRDVDGSREAGGDPSHKVLLAEKGKRGLQVAYRLLLRARSQVCRHACNVHEAGHSSNSHKKNI